MLSLIILIESIRGENETIEIIAPAPLPHADFCAGQITAQISPTQGIGRRAFIHPFAFIVHPCVPPLPHRCGRGILAK